jgi:D-amino-acid dehydrogenase
VTGVTVGADRIGADAVVAAAGAWTAGVCAPLGLRVPAGPQRGQIVHARRPGPAPPRGRPCCPPRTGTWSPSPPGGSWPARPGTTLGFAYHATAGGIGGLLAAAARLAPGLRHAELLATRIGSRPSPATAAPCPARSPTP